MNVSRNISAALLALLIAAACTDHSYDLGRMDREIVVAPEGLTLPLGSTRQIMIGDLLGERLGDILSLEDDGSYAVRYQAPSFSATVDALEGYDGAAPFRKYCDYPIGYYPSLFAKPSAESLVFDEQGEASLSGVIPATVKLATRMKTTAVGFGNLPEEVVGLQHIGLSPEKSKFEITVSVDGCPLSSGAVIPALEIDLSHFFGSPEADSEGIILFSEPLTPENGFKATASFSLNSCIFDPEAFDAALHFIRVNATLGFSGSVSFSEPRTTREKLAEAPDDIQLSIVAVLRNLTLDTVGGYFDYTAARMQSAVAVKEMVDKLTGRIGDPDVVFDFDDPEIVLDIASNITIPIAAIIDVAANKNKRKVAEIRNLQVEFPLAPVGGTVHRQIRFARTPSAGDEDFVEADFSKMIASLPDEIAFSVKGSTIPDRLGSVSIGELYSIEVNPRLNIPLAFGPKLKVSLRDTLSLPESLGETVAGNAFTLEADVTNSLPLQVELTIRLIDEAGNVVFAPDRQKLEASATSRISFPVSSYDAGRFSRASKALLSFQVSGTDEVRPILADDYIQAVLRLILPQGLHTSI